MKRRIRTEKRRTVRAKTKGYLRSLKSAWTEIAIICLERLP